MATKNLAAIVYQTNIQKAHPRIPGVSLNTISMTFVGKKVSIWRTHLRARSPRFSGVKCALLMKPHSNEDLVDMHVVVLGRGGKVRHIRAG